jgi:hypothetical protein
MIVRRPTRSFSQWGEWEYPVGYATSHSVWLIIVDLAEAWQLFLRSFDAQPLIKVICVRWEFPCVRRALGLVVLLGLCTPVLHLWIGSFFGRICTAKCTPLRTSVGTITAFAAGHVKPGMTAQSITHEPAVSRHFGMYARTYGYGYDVTADWEVQSLSKGDPPWVFRACHGIDKNAYKRYLAAFTLKKSTGFPCINRVELCMFVMTDYSLRSIILNCESRHGRGSCAGFSLSPDRCAIDVYGWAGKPIAVVDCTLVAYSLSNLIAIVRVSNAPVNYGCIAMFLHWRGQSDLEGDGRIMAADEFDRYYPAVKEASWRAENISL